MKEYKRYVVTIVGIKRLSMEDFNLAHTTSVFKSLSEEEALGEGVKYFFESYPEHSISLKPMAFQIKDNRFKDIIKKLWNRKIKQSK